MRCVASGNRHAVAEGNGGDEHINVANERAALFQVGPNIGCENRSRVSKRQNVVKPAKLFKSDKLSRGVDGFQPPRHFVV